jgi:hypothetical protein
MGFNLSSGTGRIFKEVNDVVENRVAETAIIFIPQGGTGEGKTQLISSSL